MVDFLGSPSSGKLHAAFHTFVLDQYKPLLYDPAVLVLILLETAEKAKLQFS